MSRPVYQRTHCLQRMPWQRSTKRKGRGGSLGGMHRFLLAFGLSATGLVGYNISDGSLAILANVICSFVSDFVIVTLLYCRCLLCVGAPVAGLAIITDVGLLNRAPTLTEIEGYEQRLGGASVRNLSQRKGRHEPAGYRKWRYCLGGTQLRNAPIHDALIGVILTGIITTSPGVAVVFWCFRV